MSEWVNGEGGERENKRIKRENNNQRIKTNDDDDDDERKRRKRPTWVELWIYADVDGWLSRTSTIDIRFYLYISLVSNTKCVIHFTQSFYTRQAAAMSLWATNEHVRELIIHSVTVMLLVEKTSRTRVDGDFYFIDDDWILESREEWVRERVRETDWIPKQISR